MPSHAHVLGINGLAVAPARRGRGLGRALVDAALEEARRRGARKVTLRVLAPNARARRLYEACGFVVEGVLLREFLLNDRYVDDVLMACHLADRCRHRIRAASEPPSAGAVRALGEAPCRHGQWRLDQ